MRGTVLLFGNACRVVAEKREGAAMVCHKCGERLVCRMSRYMHPYANKLQWQNQDGSAHYRYDGGAFTCTGKDRESKRLSRAIREQDDLMREAELSRGGR